MQSSVGLKPVRKPESPSATRYNTNRNWYWRGDNAKPKAKK